jgi:hypothetical protein
MDGTYVPSILFVAKISPFFYFKHKIRRTASSESNSRIVRRNVMIATEIEMARSGEFLREYGSKYFIAVTEALNIGRVKVEMVPKGSGGQNGIVFYLTVEKMLNLCSEILNGVFAKKIAADTGNYPTAYQYVTGDDGCLKFNIGNGKAGICVQMMNSKSKLNYIMGIPAEALTTMARKYMLCTGMTPVVKTSYYGSVIDAFELGRKERAKFLKKPAEELGDVIDANAIVDDAEDVVEKPKPKAEEPKAEAKPAPKTETKTATDKAATVEEKFVVNISGNKSINKGFYVFHGTDDQKNAIRLMFRKADADKLSWFTDFENAAAAGSSKIAIMGEKKNDCILYKGPAKK